MQALPTGGAMAAIEATEDEISPVLDGRVGLAAVNGPRSLVISGYEDDVTRIAQDLRAQGRRVKRLRTSHAFHSPLMEPILDDFRAVVEKLTFNPPTLPVRGDAIATPEYWVQHIRKPVRFADAITASQADIYLEIGPDAVLTPLVDNAFALLRADRPEPGQVMAALTHAFTHGASVNWASIFEHTSARHVELPTYPFQRHHYWLTPTTTDVTTAGLTNPHHPLLGAHVDLPDGCIVLTGRLSLGVHRWLTDHAVFGAVPLPGAAFVELALSAGDRVGCPRVEELVLSAPLVLTGGDQIHLQVAVGALDEQDRRTFIVRSRHGGESETWTQHAAGVLGPDVAVGPGLADRQWPPGEAIEIDLTDVYDTLREHGYEYGPAFQGLRRLWQHEDETFAEVALPADQVPGADGFALHPALLDAAVHSLLPGVVDHDRAAGLPFAWAGVGVHAAGATRLRVHLTPTGPETVALRMFGSDGAPVAAIDALTWREASEELVRGEAAARPGPLFGVEWVSIPVPVPSAASEPTDWAVWGDADTGLAVFADLEARDAVPTVVVAPRTFGPTPADAARQALALAQGWLADSRFAQSRLVVLTGGAAGPDATDLAGAAAWGLLRSAQTENPDRLILVDTDGDTPAWPLLSAVVSSGEPQVVLRGDTALAPRVTRLPTPNRAPSFPAAGTTLITGGTGVLGSLFARHLVAVHGVRRLLLTSRRGPDAPGVRALIADLAEQGAVAEVVACDLADRAAVEGLLAAVPQQYPLTAVVHLAGTADDGVISSLTPERLERTLAPKADGAQHLHELTRGLDLSAFVLFSSIAATFGAPGQGNYAAANAVLDGLARVRHAEGLPVLTLSWGLWARSSGITGHLGEADLRRIARAGVLPLDDRQGLDLFDAALSGDAPWVLPMRLDLAALRAQRDALPAALRGLVPATRRAAERTGGPTLAERLERAEPQEREKVVADLVCTEVAVVLGYPGPDAVDRDRALAELGFDSLTAIDLRNRLKAATGLNLPATLAFDYPTPTALIGYLRAQASPVRGGRTVLDRIDDLATALSEIDPAGRAEAVARLRALLATSDAGLRAHAALADASADEVFDFVTHELGISLS